MSHKRTKDELGRQVRDWRRRRMTGSGTCLII